MNPEAIHHLVPDGGKCVDEQCLTQRDPDIIDNEVAEVKVLDPKILSVLDGTSVLSQPCVEF
jgi:hypothetical protein